MDRSALYDFIERARDLRRREELDAATIEVLDLFDATGIRSLLLKGPALAGLLYGEREVRSYSDIDLLVSPTDLGNAREVLAGLGYKSAGELLGIDDVAGIQHSEMWGRRGDGGPLWVDLHWRLGGCEAPDEVVWEALAADSGSIELAGREATVPGTAVLALHLGLHAAQHGPRDVKARGDLARGLDRWGLDIWREAAALARRVKAVPTFAAGLRLVPEGAALATELRLPETKGLEWQIHHREARPRGTFHLRALGEARGLRQRANVLRRSLLPAREWITYQLPWATKGKAALVAAYAFHVVRAPAWAARAALFWLKARRARRGS